MQPGTKQGTTDSERDRELEVFELLVLQRDQLDLAVRRRAVELFGLGRLREKLAQG